MRDLIGRAEVYRSLKKVLSKEANKKLTIMSLAGPGGIGKTYLKDRVMDDVELKNKGYLVLSIQGDEERDLTFQLLTDLKESCKKQLDYKEGHFIEIGKLENIAKEFDLKLKEQIKKDIEKEIEKGNYSKDILDECINVMDEMDIFNIEKFKNFAGDINFAMLARRTKEIVDKFKEKNSKAILNGRLPANPFNKRKRQYVLDPEQKIATALYNDLEAALVPTSNMKFKNKFKFREKSKEFDKLFLVIDDYESKSEALNDFLSSNLFPLLKHGKFATKVLILGRDRLRQTHACWDQHYENNLIFDEVLDVFTHDDTRLYLNHFGIFEEEKVDKIHEVTQGFPYLVALEAQDDNSAISKKLFFDRTTRWMSKRQKEWFIELCYLEKINRDIIKIHFEKSNSDEIYEWFINEASIRDPRNEYYRVGPFIASKMKDYMEIQSPRKNKYFINKAKITIEKAKKDVLL